MKHVLSICLNIRSQTQCEINSHSPGITSDGRKEAFRATKHRETPSTSSQAGVQARNIQILQGDFIGGEAVDLYLSLQVTVDL